MNHSSKGATTTNYHHHHRGRDDLETMITPQQQRNTQGTPETVISEECLLRLSNDTGSEDDDDDESLERIDIAHIQVLVPWSVFHQGFITPSCHSQDENASMDHDAGIVTTSMPVLPTSQAAITPCDKSQDENAFMDHANVTTSRNDLPTSQDKNKRSQSRVPLTIHTPKRARVQSLAELEEEEFLAELDREITESEKISAYYRAEDERVKAEEDELMNELDQEISLAEKKTRLCQEIVLKAKEHNLLKNESNSTDDKKTVTIPNVPCFSQRVPRQMEGRKFIDLGDMLDLRQDMHEKCCFAKLDVSENDPESWLITVYANKEHVSDCHKVFERWLRMCWFRLRVIVLREFGLVSTVMYNPQLRAKLFSDGTTVMLFEPPTEMDARMAEEWKPDLCQGGVIVAQVDGKPCHSPSDFKLAQYECLLEQRMMPLSCIVPGNQTAMERCRQSQSCSVVDQAEKEYHRKDGFPDRRMSERVAQNDSAVHTCLEDPTNQAGPNALYLENETREECDESKYSFQQIEIDNVFEASERLISVLEKDSIIGFVKSLGDAGARFLLRSVELLTRMRSSIKAHVEKKELDFVTKDRFLKILVWTADLASTAPALNPSTGLFLRSKAFVDKIEMSFISGSGLCAGENLVIKLQIPNGNRKHRAQPMLVEFRADECHVFPPSSQTNNRGNGFTFSSDLLSNPEQVLEVEVSRIHKLSGKTSLVGRNMQRLKDLPFHSSRTSHHSKFSLELDFSSLGSKLLEKCNVHLYVDRCFDDSAQLEKRKQLAGAAISVIDWINSFNRELSSHETPFDLLSQIPVLGDTLLEASVRLADVNLVKKLFRYGVRLTYDVENIARAEALSPDKLSHHRKEICFYIRSWSLRGSAPDGVRSPATKQTSATPQLPDEPQFARVRDWLLARSSRCKVRCRDFQQDGRCQLGKTCFYGHVLQPSQLQVSSFVLRPKFSEDNIETMCQHDSTGSSWYTSGLIDGNEFIYAHGNGGALCKQTGVFWYTSESSAKNAIRSTIHP